MAEQAPRHTEDAPIKKALTDTSWQLASQIAPAIAALLAIPYLLRSLGAQLYGVVALLSASILFFTTLDLGLGRATTRFVARCIQAKRPEEITYYFWGAICVLGPLGIIISTLCCFAVPHITIHLIRTPNTEQVAVSTSLYIVSAIVPVIILTATVRGYLEACGRFRQIGLIAASAGAANYIAPAAAVALGGGLISIAAAFAAVRVLACAAYARSSLLAGVSDLKPALKLAPFREILGFGTWLSVSNLIGTAMVYGDRLLLGIWAGTAAVAAYATPLDVISRLQILVGSVCTVLFPIMCRLDEAKSPNFRSAYTCVLSLAVASMSLVAAFLAAGAPYLMRFWLGHKFAEASLAPARIFLAGLPVQAATAVAWTAIHGRGRSDVTAWIHAAELPIFLAAFYFGSTKLGATGAAMAWLARVIIDFIAMSITLRHLTGAHRALPAELFALGIPAGVMLVGQPSGIAAELLAALALTCAASALSWRFLLTGDARAWLRLWTTKVWDEARPSTPANP